MSPSVVMIYGKINSIPPSFQWSNDMDLAFLALVAAFWLAAAALARGCAALQPRQGARP